MKVGGGAGVVFGVRCGVGFAVAGGGFVAGFVIGGGGVVFVVAVWLGGFGGCGSFVAGFGVGGGFVGFVVAVWLWGFVGFGGFVVLGGGGFFVFGSGLVAGGEEQGEGGQQGKLGFHRLFRGLFDRVVMILRLWRVSARRAGSG